MGLNDVMARLAAADKEIKQQHDLLAAAADEKIEPITGLPSIRDLATALYKQRQNPSCRNCLRRERGDCPSKNPMPKTCVSFQLNSKQMQTYGQQARNAIAAIREAICMGVKRVRYYQLKIAEQQDKQND